MEDISAYKFACVVARILDEKKGGDIKILNISNPINLLFSLTRELWGKVSVAPPKDLHSIATISLNSFQD